MRKLFIIGIGAGSPAHLSYQAAAALSTVRAIFALDKGESKDELLALRRGIIADHAPDATVKTVTDPPRDRNPGSKEAYKKEVERWHQSRAELLKSTIENELAEGEIGAFLVWGDPSLYDSTLRIVERMRGLGLDCSVEVIPGITAIQALTAAHAILLNRIGEPIEITTGRQLRADIDAGESPTNSVVMLDAHAAWNHPGIDARRTYMWWGAYLGTEHEVLRKGWVDQIGADVEKEKTRLREENGWIMDTYLLRYFEEGEPS